MGIIPELASQENKHAMLNKTPVNLAIRASKEMTNNNTNPVVSIVSSA